MITPVSASNLSVPAPGRTIATTLRPWISSLAKAHGSLVDVFKSIPLPIEDRFAQTYLPDGRQQIAEREIPALASAALISIHLLWKTSSKGRASLRESEEWFTGSEARLLSDLLTPATNAKVHSALQGLPSGSVLEDIMPHLMEAFVNEVGTAARNPSIGRSAKRKQGLFYTPSDVARFIASGVLGTKRAEHLPNCFDPACGTGVLLRSALEVLHENTDRPKIEIARHLYGVDTSVQSVQAAVFVMLARCISSESHGRPLDLWRTIRGNFAIHDSTTLSPEKGLLDGFGNPIPCLQDLFPQVQKPFSIILGNPPYNSIPIDGLQDIRKRVSIVAGAISEKGGPQFPLFVELMWRLTDEDQSSAGMVVPLSLSYHSGNVFKTLRQEMLNTGASWRFHFFDRSPDSLFGDDVKTRNAIVFMKRGRDVDQEITTSSLYRWSSRNRGSLFQDPPTTRLKNPNIRAFIPKIGSDLEERVYVQLRKHRNPESLGNRFKPRSLTEVTNRDIYHYSTAYNWLPFSRVLPECYDPEGQIFVPDSLSGIRLSSSFVAGSVFAVVLSRLAYWLWRVEGDGFHLPHTFMMRFPFYPSRFSTEGLESLAMLGDRLWREMHEHPVFATNGGVQTCNFSPLDSAPTIDEIDRVLIRELALPTEFVDFVKQFHQETIDAGRGSNGA